MLTVVKTHNSQKNKHLNTLTQSISHKSNNTYQITKLSIRLH